MIVRIKGEKPHCIPNLALYNVDTQKHSEVKTNFPPLRAGTPKLRQVNSQFRANKISTPSYFRTNPYNVGTHKPINENSHFPSIGAHTFQPMQINPNSPQYNIGTHRPSPVYPYHSSVNTDRATTKGSNTHNPHTQNNTSYNTHMGGRYASTTATAHIYQTQHSTEYCKAYQCASHTPDYQPISKLLGKDENAVLAILRMRTMATPADGHCLLHAFIRTKEIKYGNSDPCNERENKLLELIKSMKNEFLQSKNIYSEFTSNVEALTKDVKATTWI